MIELDEDREDDQVVCITFLCGSIHCYVLSMLMLIFDWTAVLSTYVFYFRQTDILLYINIVPLVATGVSMCFLPIGFVALWFTR